MNNQDALGDEQFVKQKYPKADIGIVTGAIFKDGCCFRHDFLGDSWADAASRLRAEEGQPVGEDDEDSKYAAVIAEERQAILDEVAACLCPREMSRKEFDWATRTFRPVPGIDHGLEQVKKQLAGGYDVKPNQ